MSLPFTPERAILCETHKLLNPQLIRQIFHEVEAECTTHLETLFKNHLPPPAVSAFLMRIRKVKSLWGTPEASHSRDNPRLANAHSKHVSSCCEACILACIGGNIQVLSDTRASIIGRRKRGHPLARVLPLVEAWIDGTGRGDAIRMESDVLMQELRRCRRQMQKERRQKQHKIAGGKLDSKVGSRSRSTTLVDEEENGVKDEHDFEGSIIDYYVHRISAFVDTGARENGGTRLDFRQFMFEADGNPLQRIVSDSWSPKQKPSVYSASLYDTDSEPPGSMECNAGWQKSPNYVADEYIRLIGGEAGADSGPKKEDEKIRREASRV